MSKRTRPQTGGEAKRRRRRIRARLSRSWHRRHFVVPDGKGGHLVCKLEDLLAADPFAVDREDIPEMTVADAFKRGEPFPSRSPPARH